MNTIKAVIFDMDGVLIDAREWHYESLNYALSFFGFEISRADHLLTFDGLPTSTKLKMMSQVSNLPEELHSLVNSLKKKHTMRMIYQECGINFIHKYALSKLKRDGYLLAVASNSIRTTVDSMMELAKLAEYLEFTLSNEDVAAAKPDPEIYNLAISRLGLKASECLIVEDNVRGIEAAKRSGAFVLEVGSVDDVTYEAIVSRISDIERMS